MFGLNPHFNLKKIKNKLIFNIKDYLLFRRLRRIPKKRYKQRPIGEKHTRIGL
jgi:hypothetical protein